MKRTIFALIFATLGTHTAFAVAKPVSAPVTSTEPSKVEDEASQRFQKGVKLFRERSFDAALAEFARAYDLSPDYRVLYNLAQVQAERGDYVAAAGYFRKYLKEGGTSIDAARASDVRAEIAQLEGRIARLTITSNVDGAEVFIDGESVGALSSDGILVNSGIRRVVLKKQGYKAEEQRLTLTGGEEKKLKVELVAENGNAKPAIEASPRVADNSKETSEAGWRPNTGFWLSLAATGVAAGGTVAFALMTRSDKDDFESELNRFPGTASRIDDARSRWKRDALLTDGCAALTLVGIGATVYFAVTGTHDNTKEAPVAKQAKARTLNVFATPTMGRDGFGMQFDGQF